MVNGRIGTSAANVAIRGATVNVRLRSFQTGRVGDSGASTAGTPIGLLLALTYASLQNLPVYGDLRPNVRIRTD